MADKIDAFRHDHPDLAGRPFALTTFSNNGLQTWDQLRHNFAQPEAFIFDSGPTMPTELESFPIPGRIFAANNPNAPILQKALVALVGNIGYALGRAWLLKMGGSDLELMTDLLVPRLSRDMINGSPSMILFGEGDLLIPESAARRVFEMFLEQGNEHVEYHVLPGGHCTILKESRDVYVKLVDQFLAATLSSSWKFRIKQMII